jgi:hypothetical protein
MADASMGGSAGANTGGSGPSLDAGRDAARDAGPNCSALASDLQQKLAAAQSCSTDVVGACQDSVEGLCCTVLVAAKDTIATHNYLNALAAYLNSACPYGCTAMPCLMGPGACKDNPNGTSGGKSCQR